MNRMELIICVALLIFTFYFSLSINPSIAIFSNETAPFDVGEIITLPIR